MFLKMKNNKLNSIKFINKHKINISFMYCYIDKSKEDRKC